MKFRSGVLFVGVVLLGLVGTASAATLGYSLDLVYVGSYDADGNALDPLTTTVTDLGNSTNRTSVDLTSNPLAVYHQFGVMLTANGLATNQDIMQLQYHPHAAGGVTVDGGPVSTPFAANDFAIDPPPMGSPSSDAPKDWWSDLNELSNPSTFSLSVRADFHSNGLFGDCVSYLHIGEAGSIAAYATPTQTSNWTEQTGPFRLGDLYLKAAGDMGAGTFNFSFNGSGGVNPGEFSVLNNDANGQGTLADLNETISYTAYSGEVLFMAPEPSTLALLGCGLFGLLAYAWRKRK